jgi:hypothetical protein
LRLPIGGLAIGDSNRQSAIANGNGNRESQSTIVTP